MAGETDIEILRRLRSGDEAALKPLFDRYYMPLCIHSMQLTDSLDVSEDLVQDLFVSFWEKKIYLTIEVSLRAYLFSSVRNLSINYMRKERPYALCEMEESLCLIDEEAEVSELELQERHRRLHEALKELSPQEHRVLRAVVFENKKYKEAADELGLSVNSVKTYLARAFRLLRSKALLTMLCQVLTV